MKIIAKKNKLCFGLKLLSWLDMKITFVFNKVKKYKKKNFSAFFT